MIPENIPMTTATVVCHTEGCLEFEVGSSATVATDPTSRTVRCGQCGQEITDITLA